MPIHYHHKADCKAGCGHEPCSCDHGHQARVAVKQREENRRINLMRFCPVCGKPLEIHPSAGMPACFLHGDVVIRHDGVFFQIAGNI